MTQLTEQLLKQIEQIHIHQRKVDKDDDRYYYETVYCLYGLGRLIYCATGETIAHQDIRTFEELNAKYLSIAGEFLRLNTNTLPIQKSTKNDDTGAHSTGIPTAIFTGK